MTATLQAMRWLVVTLLALAAAVVLVPQAQAAFPGRNGGLLVGGFSRSFDCGDPPRVPRAADDYESCSYTVPPTALFLVWRESRRISRAFGLTCGGDEGRLSPDGVRVICRTRDGRLRVQTPQGGFSLARRGERAAWFPDGRRVVVERGGGLYVVDVNSGTRGRFLRRGTHPAVSVRGDIARSPSGSARISASASAGCATRSRRPRPRGSSTSRVGFITT